MQKRGLSLNASQLWRDGLIGGWIVYCGYAGFWVYKDWANPLPTMTLVLLTAVAATVAYHHGSGFGPEYLE